ncbi:MAG: hypothetical protein I3270_01895 [Candidatus Moeniiplasma glomeromycotorum]|nr:hypothetical protein [Candidatus Moeniiplasma glomeromycotorum]MCE8162454.1 hypothetical protein [Candidatus Moeniiplasma glomeromycotorum]MCE8166380.1 hypothetical protein [Candidatus Moeniiplasma glomeromycotorum]MCE8166862.1 hypothetical protein [Candidatus Moeniiplasma glomeromycotorum]
MNIFEWLDKNLKGFSDFLKGYIQPFLTPFFAATAYFALTSTIKEATDFWKATFLIVSIIYFFLSLGLAIFSVIQKARGIK